MRYYTDGMSPRPTYENKRQTTVDDLWERVVNAPAFSYDAESDPVYKSYKDMYTREGQRAMQDTLAALSIDAGGENSWAVSAAAQAQNRYMQELADKVPELYNLAYDRYMTERNADMNKLALARDMENTDYGRYIDAMDIYQTDRGYYDTQMDKWNAEAQQYKTDAKNDMWTLVNAGEAPSDELLAAAGITDKEQIKNIAGVNKSMIGYELAGMGIEQKMNELALQEALGQLAGGSNYYRYQGPRQPNENEEENFIGPRKPGQGGNNDAPIGAEYEEFLQPLNEVYEESSKSVKSFINKVMKPALQKENAVITESAIKNMLLTNSSTYDLEKDDIKALMNAFGFDNTWVDEYKNKGLFGWGDGVKAV